MSASSKKKLRNAEQAAKMTYMAKTIKVNGLTDAEKLGIDGMKA